MLYFILPLALFINDTVLKCVSKYVIFLETGKSCNRRLHRQSEAGKSWPRQMLGRGVDEEGSMCVCVCFLERFIELTEPMRFIGIYEWFVSVTI